MQGGTADLEGGPAAPPKYGSEDGDVPPPAPTIRAPGAAAQTRVVGGFAAAVVGVVLLLTAALSMPAHSWDSVTCMGSMLSAGGSACHRNVNRIADGLGGDLPELHGGAAGIEGNWTHARVTIMDVPLSAPCDGLEKSEDGSPCHRDIAPEPAVGSTHRRQGEPAGDE